MGSSHLSPQLARQILQLNLSAADHLRYRELSAKAQEGTLSTKERDELEAYLGLNDFLIILKAKAEASLGPPDPAA
jgi:hypothetical protein